VVGNPPGTTTSQTSTGATGGDVPTIPGDTPALYGGSRNEHVCDSQKLVTYLQQNPDKAAAWAGVLNISVADIPTYIGTLTPMQLRADTRVTNHGFIDGHATTLQSVLQAGTAVLVDNQGRPRVKCGCGNPLLYPVATPITPSYTGTPWPGFNPRNISAISPAKTPVVWVPETSPTAVDLVIRGRRWPGMIRRVAVKLIYQVFAKLLSWMVLHARSDTATRSRSLPCATSWPCCSGAHPDRGSAGPTAR
jgi:hypothetical protein